MDIQKLDQFLIINKNFLGKADEEFSFQQKEDEKTKFEKILKALKKAPISCDRNQVMKGCIKLGEHLKDVVEKIDQVQKNYFNEISTPIKLTLEKDIQKVLTIPGYMKKDLEAQSSFFKNLFNEEKTGNFKISLDKYSFGIEEFERLLRWFQGDFNPLNTKEACAFLFPEKQTAYDYLRIGSHFGLVIPSFEKKMMDEIKSWGFEIEAIEKVIESTQDFEMIPEVLKEKITNYFEKAIQILSSSKIEAVKKSELISRSLQVLKTLNVESLSLLYSTGLDIKELTKFKGLKTLDLRRNEITDQDMKDLAEIGSLKHLVLSWCEKITDKGVKKLKKLTSLTNLDLYGCKEITDESVNELAKMSLINLNLGSCTKITDKSVKKIAKMTSLTDLNLSFCNVTNESIKDLAEMVSLTNLDLYACEEITDEIVNELLSKNPNLKIIR